MKQGICENKRANELPIYVDYKPIQQSRSKSELENKIKHIRLAITPYTIDFYKQSLAHMNTLYDKVIDLPKPLGLVGAGLCGLLAKSRTKQILTSLTAMGLMSGVLYPSESKELLGLGLFMSKKWLKEKGLIK